MNIPDQAIQAAARAIFITWDSRNQDTLGAAMKLATAKNALEAALPHIEAALRTQIANDIRAEIADYGEPLPYRDGVYAGLTQAAYTHAQKEVTK